MCFEQDGRKKEEVLVGRRELYLFSSVENVFRGIINLRELEARMARKRNAHRILT
jgi:hypothetical protein